jgi:hypothetical protein
MARPAQELFDTFHRRLLKLERTEVKVEALFATGKLTKFDIEQIYSGLYLDVFVSFERFLEDLFVGLISGKIDTGVSARPKLQINTTALALEIMHTERKYLDWLPYKYTKERAGHYLKDGLSFSRVDGPQERILEEMHRIRNALAHRSIHSLDIFDRLVAQQYPVAPGEKRPASFLRSSLRAFPPQTRFEHYLFEIATIARGLC